MRMVKCKNCGKVYHSQLSNCPECFTKNKSYTAGIFVGVFVFVFVFTMIMIGVTLNDNPNEFINQADKGLYLSKNNGRNRVTFFDPNN